MTKLKSQRVSLSTDIPLCQLKVSHCVEGGVVKLYLVSHRTPLVPEGPWHLHLGFSIHS